jgi:hypothetical protein
VYSKYDDADAFAGNVLTFVLQAWSGCIHGQRRQ